MHGLVTFARADDEAYALSREALTTSGDICPVTANCSSGSTRSRSLRPGGPRPWPRSATTSAKPMPAIPVPTSSCATRSNPTQTLHKRSPYVGSPGVSFESAIVTKRQRRLSGHEITTSLWLKGLTHGNVAAHLAEVYGANVSSSSAIATGVAARRL